MTTCAPQYATVGMNVITQFAAALAVRPIVVKGMVCGSLHVHVHLPKLQLAMGHNTGSEAACMGNIKI